ncbi:MAG: YkgJ family cysteine cluster protein [Candidatus Hodarchaeota archaeon]
MWECRPNCGECCGSPAIPIAIFEKYKEKAQKRIVATIPFDNGKKVIPLTQDRTCAFLNDDKTCAIYFVRPKVCRDYGRSDDYPCPYIGVNGKPRSPEDVKKIKKYLANQHPG